MASILPFLFVYVVSTPNFAAMLVTNSTALGRFLRQVMTNGLPVVFIVNYIGFVFAHNTLNNPDRSEIEYIVLDGLLRSATFIAIHILVYVLSADLFGSFGGNRATAVSVVGPTLERSFMFHNISGVYLYAVVPGAFIALLAVLTKRSGETSDTSKSKTRNIALLFSLVSIPGVTVLSYALNSAT